MRIAHTKPRDIPLGDWNRSIYDREIMSRIRGRLFAARAFIIATVIFAVLDVFATVLALVSIHDINVEKVQRQIQVTNEVRGLACYLVKGVPDSADPRVHDFRAQYHCPPYVKLHG